MRLLERERETADLELAIGEASGGRGCAVAIEGDAGVGKTSLLEQACHLGSDAGLRVLHARATELERGFPFSVVRQLFQRPLTEMSPEQRETVLSGASTAEIALGLDGSSRGDLDLFAVLSGLYWVTAALAEREPLLLAIDDAHLADDGSLDFLTFILPRLEALPVLLALAGRRDHPEYPAGLETIVSDQAMRNVSLGPLSADSTAVLITERMGAAPDRAFAAACSKATGGNPFLLSELVRTLVEQGVHPTESQVDQVEELVPDRVARAVHARVSRLSPFAGEVARALAILGDGADVRLLSELADIEVAQAQETTESLRGNSIVDGDAAPRFIHPLVRNAVYERIPPLERARDHARAAALLRSRGADHDQVAAQLLVSERRGDPEAVETLLQVSERALSTGAPRPAITYLTRALEEPPPLEMRRDVLFSLLTAGFRAADHAVLNAIESDVEAELQREPALRTRWAMTLAMALLLGGRSEEATSVLRSATTAAAEEGDLELAFRLDAQLNVIALFLPGVPQRTDLGRYADQIDRDGPAGRLMAAMEVRTAVVNAEHEKTVEAASRALGNNGSIFADEPELSAPAAVVMALVVADELDLAREGANRAFEVGSERGATPELSLGCFLKGFVAWGEGDLINSEVDLRRAVELARLAGIVPAIPTYAAALVEVLIERDEMDAAEAELEAIGMGSGSLPDVTLFSFPRLVRAHLWFERGDYERSLGDVEWLVRAAEKMDFGPGPLFTACPYFVRALVATERQAEAREVAEKMLAVAEHWGTASGIAHVLSAVAFVREGEDQLEPLERAAAAMEGAPQRMQRARAEIELGAALRRVGRRREARVPLREALRLARRCGGMRIARRAHHELQATGEKVPRLTAVGVESLTPSERRVADLAASGLSNRQIAQSLFVTVKTVEAHLSATYDKLDISSRDQLGRLLQPDSTS